MTGATPRITGAERLALLTFDFESGWGMPYSAAHDLDRGTSHILDALAACDARATFFVVGELAVERPDLIAAIADAGHEIALHGWQHEDLGGRDPTRLSSFHEGLERAVEAVAAATGTAPDGFRAPYLLAPRFHDSQVDDLLIKRAFRYTSNRELRHPVELLRPDRLGSERPWRALESRRMLQSGRGASATRIALNPGVWLPLTRAQSPRPGIRWLLHGSPPFQRRGLLEIPLYAPMDCDLIGLPRPSERTPTPLLEFARAALRACVQSPSALTLLTFHDWILAERSRLGLMRSVLSAATEQGRRVTSVRDGWDFVLAQAVSGT